MLAELESAKLYIKIYAYIVIRIQDPEFQTILPHILTSFHIYLFWLGCPSFPQIHFGLKGLHLVRHLTVSLVYEASTLAQDYLKKLSQHGLEGIHCTVIRCDSSAFDLGGSLVDMQRQEIPSTQKHELQDWGRVWEVKRHN